jgi:hypothetical protein
MYRTDNLMSTLVNPAKDGGGDWSPTRCSIRTFFDDMERDLQHATLAPNHSVPIEGFTNWVRDAGRQQHYYFCSMDRTYKYESGAWVRLDGSSTSLEQGMELAKAYGIPVRSQGHLTMDCGETPD